MYDNVTFITDVQGNSKWESIVDILQKESLQEGNDSIHPDKFNVRETQGKTILFPPFWTHRHQGAPVKIGTKYIATTWIVFA